MNGLHYRMILAAILISGAVATADPAPLPGQELIQKCSASWSTRSDWEARATSLRKQILGPLYPWPAQTPLNPIYREKLSREGYTVQPVAFESMPGFYCCADLYMPTDSTGKHPAII